MTKTASRRVSFSLWFQRVRAYDNKRAAWQSVAGVVQQEQLGSHTSSDKQSRASIDFGTFVTERSVTEALFCHGLTNHSDSLNSPPPPPAPRPAFRVLDTLS